MATSLATPPRAESSPFNELISITPWTTTRPATAVVTPTRSTSRSKRVTRSGRYSLATIGDENDSIRVTTPLNHKARSLLDAVTPSLNQTTLSTPLIPSSSHAGLLKSALEKNPVPLAPLQERNVNSPCSTVTIGRGGTPARLTAVPPEGSTTTAVRSPTKTLRFDTDVFAKDFGTGEKASGLEVKANLTSPGGTAAQDAEDQRLSDSDEDEGAGDLSQTLSAPATPISALPSHLLPQTPSAYTFSPATPIVRTHESYEEDELTDCDADFSIYDDEASFAFTNVSKLLQPHLGDEPVIEGIEAEEEERSPRFEDVEPVLTEGTETEKLDDIAGFSQERDDQDDKEEAEAKESVEKVDPTSGDTAKEHDARLPDETSKPEEVSLQGEEVQGGIDDEGEARQVEEVQQENRELAASEHRQPSVEEVAPAVELGFECFQHRPCTPDAQPIDIACRPSPFLEVSRESPVSAFVPGPTPHPVGLITPAKAPVQRFATSPSASNSIPPEPLALPQTSRTVQSQVHDAPTARRQLTKLSSLASKKSSDTLQDSARRSGLTAMVPGSSSAGNRMPLGPTRPATLVASTPLPATSRPTTMASKLAQPSSVRSRMGSESIAAQRSTVNENCPPSNSSTVMQKSTKLSTSLPPSTSMKPPTSTIPRPRPTVARSGLKPPSAATPSVARAVAGTAALSRATLSTTKLQRPVPASLSRSVPPARSARPDLAASSSAPRPLPPLQQTSSAPSVLASSNRGPTPPLQQLPIHNGPPVPRSARPANLVRGPPPTLTTSTPVDAVLEKPVRATSPQKQRAPVTVPLITRPAVSEPGLSQSADPPVVRPSSQAESPPALDPSAPVSVTYTSSVFSSPATVAVRSPPRRQTAPTSPLRSPRRVPLNQPLPPAFPSVPSTTTPTTRPVSALVIPAERLASTSSCDPVDVFGVQPLQPVVARSSRIRSTKTPEQNCAPLPVKRVTRRAAAAAAASTSTESQPFPAASAFPPKSTAPLIPRSSRRPPKPSPVATEIVEEEPSADTVVTKPDSVAPSFTARPSLRLFHSNPAPVLTQEELNRLTQRNTKKNQKSFNKIEIETVFLDENRPPSPTSKIRKSFGQDPGSEARDADERAAASKESREARAAKRRRALRSSTDGSELEVLRAELGDPVVEGDHNNGRGTTASDLEAVKVVSPVLHFRAPGDEEQFSSPARPVKLSGGKKKASVTNKTVRWDKALVYEGPKGDSLTDSVNGIIKVMTLDKWGNSIETSTNYAKPCPVVVRKRVFRDDEQ